MSLFRRPKPGAAIQDRIDKKKANGDTPSPLGVDGPWALAAYTIGSVFSFLGRIFSGRNVFGVTIVLVVGWLISQAMLLPENREALDITEVLAAFGAVARAAPVAFGGWILAAIAIVTGATYAVSAEHRLRKLGARAADKRNDQDPLRVRAADPPDPEAYAQELKERLALDSEPPHPPKMTTDDHD